MVTFSLRFLHPQEKSLNFPWIEGWNEFNNIFELVVSQIG